MPLNCFDGSFRSFEQQVLPEVQKRGMAALGMKSLGGHGQPLLHGLVRIEEALGYAMSLPVACTISGVDSISVLRQNLAIARGFKPMSADQMQAHPGQCRRTRAFVAASLTARGHAGWSIATGDAIHSAEAPQALAAPRTGHGQLGLGVAAIFLLALLAYWPALRGEFLWDDLMLVQGNPLVKGTLGIGTIWFRTDFPLSTVALWVQWQLWGNNPIGYHVVNVLLHATSAVLLWRLLLRLRIPGGWLAGVLFAVHPVCVASVAWISELKNTLSLPFYLLSVLLFLRGDAGSAAPRIEDGESRIEGPARLSSILHPPSSSGFGLTYWLSLLAFLLALLSKTSTVMLPTVLLASAWWQRRRLTLRDLSRTGLYFILALAFGVMSVWYQARGAIVGATVQTESIWGRLAGAGIALWFYLGKALLPVHLSMVYPRWTIPAATPSAYLPLLLWIGLLGLCWWCRRSRGRHMLLGLGCFTLNLLPVLGFVDMYFLALSRVSDHFAYLPLTAIVAMAGAGLCLLPGTLLLRCVGGALVLALSLLTAQHAQIFATEQALWEDTLARNPGAWIANANMGWILASQGKYDAAIDHLEASLRSNPNNAQAHCNLGRVLSLQGKFGAADTEFQAALKLKPQDASIRRSYGSALADAGRKEEAVRELREAIRLQADLQTHLQLAKLLHQMGQSADAGAEYRQVLARQPDSVEALSNLAWLLATGSEPGRHDGAEAVQLAEKACRLTGYHQAQTLGVLAAAYAEAGKFNDAVNTVQQAIELANAAGDTEFANLNRRLLGLYRSGKPYHEPPARGSRPARLP